VIIHGTDTMAFAASVLSFVLENLRKPVILTGAQVTGGPQESRADQSCLLRVAAT
jgi:L-asparaginase/Glu-tRNA(Gln) amidotransferase subunit D